MSVSQFGWKFGRPAVSRLAHRPKQRRRPLRLEALEVRLNPATVAWNVNADGFWDVATNWLDEFDVARVPGAGDDVVIDRPAGSYTVTYQGGDTTVQSITSAERFNLSDGTLTVTGDVSVSDTFEMLGGTLSGATVAAASTLLVPEGGGGTLDGVTIDGGVRFSNTAGAIITVTNGLTVNGTFQMQDAVGVSGLSFTGPQSLAGTGVIDLGFLYTEADTILTVGSGPVIYTQPQPPPYFCYARP